MNPAVPATVAVAAATFSWGDLQTADRPSDADQRIIREVRESMPRRGDPPEPSSVPRFEAICDCRRREAARGGR